MEIEANLEFNYGEVLSKIKGTSIKALQGTIRDVAKDMLNDILVRDFPAGRATKSYVTTGQLADTICVEGNGLELMIYVDPAKLSLEPYIDGWLGVHEGIHGEDFREPLVEGLNEGGISGSVVYPAGHSAKHFMQRAFQQYTKTFLNLLARELRGAGFEVTVG